MSDSLGNCRICGKDAGVLYPLLPGSPAFCHEHHNQQDAGKFGCDLSGPDDFDIPDDFSTIDFDPPKPQRLDRRSFIWTDKQGEQHRLRDIGDSYLSNIIRYLKRGEGHAWPEDRREKVIEFLENEAYRRVSGQKPSKRKK